MRNISDGLVVLRDGQTQKVPRSNVSPPRGGLWAGEFAMPTPDLIVLQKTLNLRGVICCLVPVAVGLIFAAAARQALHRAGSAGSLDVVLTAGAAAVCLLAALLMAFRSSPCLRGFRADRRSRTITWAASWRQKQQITFDEVAAVQITWGSIQWTGRYSTRERSTRSWEINLVLEDPPLERITVLQRSSRKKVSAEAMSLATFLDVPLIDHS